MADVKLRHGWLWLAFLAVTFTGAGLLFTPNESDDLAGLLILLSPLVVLGALMAAYYLKSRSLETE